MIGNRTEFLVGTAFAALALLGTSAAEAQSRARTANPATISFGQSVSGRLASVTPDCAVETPSSRIYRFEAEAGTRIEVTMRADDFDTLVEVGQIVDCAFVSMGSNDDGSGPEDGLNSRLVGTLPTAGAYVIRATSFGGTATGPFELALNRLPPRRAAPEPIAISLGQTLEGTLSGEDAIIADDTMNFTDDGEVSSLPSITESGRAYHLYTLTGAAGDEVVVKLSSDDFDTFLEVGVDSPLGYSVAESNDDGGEEGDGLNSRLKIRFQSAGTLTMRVSPLGSGNFGHYTLSVETPEKAAADLAQATAEAVASDTSE